MSIAVIIITGVFSCAMPMLVNHSAGGSVQLVCQRSNNNNNLIYRFHRGFYFDGQALYQLEFLQDERRKITKRIQIII
jgi:hypothetical protein